MRNGAAARILVVGAGPTGLTAALELARRGFNPRIVDANPEPSSDNRAVGINARSLEILEASGATERLLAAGRRIVRADFWIKGRIAGAVDFSRIRHRHNYLLALPQNETENILIRRLLEFGVTVERPVVARSVVARSVVDLGEAVSVVIDEGFRKTVEPYAIVIGADGVDSMIRHAAGIPFEGFESEKFWSVADYAIERWPYDSDSLNLFLNDRGHFGLAVGVGQNLYRFVANTPQTRFQVPGDYSVRQTLRESIFKVQVRQAKRYQVKNRIFLVGDAAHVHSPIGGRGMNLGVEDVAVMAQLLDEDRLQRYSSLRRPAGTTAIRLRERMVRLAEETNRVEIAIRNLMLPLVLRPPPMQRRFVARIAGLG
ncbi:MAG: NAD(P)/FAD-dependent oxidoreductase [Rhodospirillaceae bacterium]|nr:NAD(P)/FAD-dependent oxidoreductase [Rhodospirillaceae bacterium]